MCFGDGYHTKRFGKEGDDLLTNTFSLDTAQEIRTIKAKVDPSSNIDGLWFLDSNGKTILKKNSTQLDSDEWQEREVPRGFRIIGVKDRFHKANDYRFKNLQFIISNNTDKPAD